MTSHHRLQQGWVLLAILCLAFVVRIATVRFGLPALNDPDELMFEIGALHMLRGATFDPGWFGHPATTTMYVLALIDAGVFAFAQLSGRITSPRQFGDMVYHDPAWLILPGRIAMVLIAVGTVWLTWRLTDRLFGRRAAAVAALLVAFDPVHIGWSQIIRSDLMACFFMLLCLLSSVAIARRGRWRDHVSAALWLGLAIATKWPFALSGLAIAGATMLAVRSRVLDRDVALRRLVAAGFASIGFLVLVSPYLVIDYPTVLQNLQGEGQVYHLGANGGNAAYNFGWYLRGAFYAGFGAVGLVLVAVGTVPLVRRHEALAVIAPVALAFLTMLCLQHLVWERWALPLMLLGAIVAAAGLTTFADLLLRSGRLRAARWVPAVVLVAALVPLVLRDRDDGNARMNDTRQIASAWARQHIPSGDTVLVEHFASDLIGEPWHLLFPIGQAGCIEIAALLDGRTGYATIDHARGGRSNLDYGTLPAAQRARCRFHFAILAQMDRYREERDVFPAEYAAYQALRANGSVVAVFSPKPGVIGGPVVTIIRPRSS